MSAPTSPTPDKTDFRKSMESYKGKRGEFRELLVPPMRYLVVDGHGDPNTSKEFEAAIQALYPVAYAVKFASKKMLGRDYVVPPLEGLWWSENMEAFTSVLDKSQWRWALMLMVPEWVSEEMVDAGLETVSRKKPCPARIGDVRLETVDEGRCVQTLHVGSFDDEGPVLHKMHSEVIPDLGLTMTGLHHEIYLSDFRRVPPEKLQTLLRQPVLPSDVH